MFENNSIRQQSQPSTHLITLTPKGLYCAAGDFYIDPWRPVARAVITHAHADHARPGSEHYWALRSGEGLLRKRLGQGIALTALESGESFELGQARVSLHPAGHVLGSAQVRVEVGGEVWVASGDYKRATDPTCDSFEVVPCDTFITEATFALPVYCWPDTGEVVEDLLQWWMHNRARGRATVVFCYALGKAQRLLAELHRLTDETVYLHGAVKPLVDIYRQAGIALPDTQAVSEQENKPSRFKGELIIAPPGANGTAWMRRFGDCATGFCSGWMLIRGHRRRRGYDRGFVMSDHADWPALLHTIADTGAQQVLATHGQSDTLVRYLREQGVAADELRTPFGDGEDA